MQRFKISSEFNPSGDQPGAIDSLVRGISCGAKEQTLLGVTGSGKTFTMASVIEQTQRPAIIIAHNKTLAAQLHEEMRSFFPENAVEYFVSYYDYYQPEAYIPQSDVYIEKDALINDKIDLLRHSATRSLLERRDVVVVASVSCIYGLGSPELYSEMTVPIALGMKLDMCQLQERLVELQYKHGNRYERGSFSVQGDVLSVFPSHYEDRIWKISFFGDEVDSIQEVDPKSGMVTLKLEKIKIFPNSHYVTPRPTLLQAISEIEKELDECALQFKQCNKIVEADRIVERTRFDIEMMRETGTCKGIENYSRYLCGKEAGDPPNTLLDYLPQDAIMFIDESHMTVPQIRAMYNGDRMRKANLINHGFRMPSALDNRPLTFAEWEDRKPTVVYVSATPGQYELQQTGGVATEQLIRPTGLLDPVCIVKGADGQIHDVMCESQATIARGYRVLITTLTKKMAENLTEYMREMGIKVAYLHSDVKTLERIEIISDLRLGVIDVLVGVNLMREGLDIPECALVGILDADKEGFLRSTTSLIQTIGRAARNVEGRVILYANVITKSMRTAMEETDRRRDIQRKYNQEHSIVPRTIQKPVQTSLSERVGSSRKKVSRDTNTDPANRDIVELQKEMLLCAENLDFERAVEIRNEIKRLTAP
ncbi:excinuclease ABC subunit UvrB [Anaplasma marginale]|uniref:UvrABC system protein B n=2 Tax=Anaplasma marginale TaxID=770 RepID=UVRB_ANAMF|nr:excinuclease ABC subunit UvrB [Anaplasma marginale]B9KH59.1 RecName: Full=UvrABC system protein B; Short=Protein UvrB; AltName: Full=Excinuclease ABC subunit B [Anaplasma marginale str. Florida]ACM49763.1 excinuclease ABC subunit B (uvrB) [Anaplasma marginale str. Florida]AHW57131.1 excinuclease ABC subunit B protein [Anaplasma marginale]KAA8475007.1 excinuclease ABC subunit UvrB [Anaplasma marginale]KAB0452537.1 excinuclease ABC subunit UvrB [Anaplasma marginale]